MMLLEICLGESVEIIPGQERWQGADSGTDCAGRSDFFVESKGFVCRTTRLGFRGVLRGALQVFGLKLVGNVQL